jgi:hypothetical protein
LTKPILWSLKVKPALLNCMFENSVLYCFLWLCMHIYLFFFFFAPSQNPIDSSPIPFPESHPKFLLILKPNKNVNNFPGIWIRIWIWIWIWQCFSLHRFFPTDEVKGIGRSTGSRAIDLDMFIHQVVQDGSNFALWLVRNGINGAAEFCGFGSHFLALVNSGVWVRIQGLC